MAPGNEIKRRLLGVVMDAIRQGDRRPHVIALAYRIKQSPESIVHGYAHQVKALLESQNLSTLEVWRAEVKDRANGVRV